MARPLSRTLKPFFSPPRSYSITASICPFSQSQQRFYSIQSQEEAIAQLPDLDPSALQITKTTTPKALVPPEELVFGRTFTGTYMHIPWTRPGADTILSRKTICFPSNGRPPQVGSLHELPLTRTYPSIRQPAYSTTHSPPSKA